MDQMIPFNQPFLTGKETKYIHEAVYRYGKISGNGIYTRLCQDLLKNRLKAGNCLLTTSCTDALEMAAILSDVKEGDEVIVPSFTFVSSALAFIREGARIVFADSRPDHPGIDEDKIEELVTPKTKVIVPVHYAGVACDMSKISEIARRHNLMIVEDAAQAIDSYYIGNDEIRRPLGSIGQFGCFSFHETKNIQCGEGGLLAINDPQFEKRAEIIWEKGTNRAEFFRGEINKYGWVDTGSSFLPSEITAAFLYAQLENLEKIQSKRKQLWETYSQRLSPHSEKGYFRMPFIPGYATNNAHMFYLVCNTLEERTRLIAYLKKAGVMAVFHYQSLHKSHYYTNKHDGRPLPNSDRYTDCQVRLPLYFDLTLEQVGYICDQVEYFYNN